MKLVTYLRRRYRRLIARRISDAKRDIRFAKWMIRDCDKEMRIGVIPWSQSIRAINLNEERIEREQARMALLRMIAI